MQGNQMQPDVHAKISRKRTPLIGEGDRFIFDCDFCIPKKILVGLGCHLECQRIGLLLDERVI
jgi:hypothetical protein